MHPLVRDLYKRFILVGRDYPLGLPYVREKAKIAFLKNANIQSEDELMRAIYKGRWWVKEMIGIIQLRKYRAMRSKYGAGAGIGSEAPLDYSSSSSYTVENIQQRSNISLDTDKITTSTTSLETIPKLDEPSSGKPY